MIDFGRLDAVLRNTEWHANHDKYGQGKMLRQAEKQMEAEISQANQELKVLRNRRLQELYQAEWKE